MLYINIKFNLLADNIFHGTLKYLYIIILVNHEKCMQCYSERCSVAYWPQLFHHQSVKCGLITALTETIQLLG